MFLLYPQKIFFNKNSTIMKNESYENKTVLSVFFKNLAKNFAALFESGSKREFQRLKDFITS
jgi:hypothetical protein